MKAGRIYLGGTLVAKPSVWEELPEPIHYEMVDLGLPSGLKWADRNIGAEKPEAYGDYFAWGETAPRGDDWATEAPYDLAHAPFNNGSSSYDSGYFSRVSGDVCPGGVLASEYDAAHIIMGGSWRMPTAGEMRELISGTTQSLETLNGVKGVRVTSKVNENSIFIPFAGNRSYSDVLYVGSSGNAWSSSLNATFGFYSFIYRFDETGLADVSAFNRHIGYAVRGVC